MDRFLKFLKIMNESIGTSKELEQKIYSELMDNFLLEDIFMIKDQWLKLRRSLIESDNVGEICSYFYDIYKINNKNVEYKDFSFIFLDFLILEGENFALRLFNDKEFLKNKENEVLNKISAYCDVLIVVEKVLCDMEHGYFNKQNFKCDDDMFKEALSDLKNLSKKIEQFQNKVGYTDEDTITMEINRGNAESLFLLDEIANICYDLECVKRRIDSLNRPICFYGTISKDNDGKYKIEDRLLEKGNIIECLVKDTRVDANEDCERVFWTNDTIVEKADGDLGLAYHSEVELDGLFYRRRY